VRHVAHALLRAVSRLIVTRFLLRESHRPTLVS